MEEIAALRREVRRLGDRVAVLEEAAEARRLPEIRGAPVESSGSEMAAEREVVDEPARPTASTEPALPAQEQEPAAGGLRPICLVEEPALRELLVVACEAGELSLEVRELARRAGERFQDRGNVAGWLPEALRREVGRSSLRATALFPGTAPPDTLSVAAGSSAPLLAALEREVASGAGQSGGEVATEALIVAPVFRELCWPLLEAVLRAFRRERLVPRLDLVHAAVRSLLVSGDGAAPVRDLDLLAVLRLAPTRAGADGSAIGATAGATPQGQVVIEWLAEDMVSTEAPLPLFAPQEQERLALEAASGTPDAAKLLATAVAAVPHLGTLRKLAGGGEAAALDVVALLTPLRAPRLAEALRLPAALREASGGALCWACDCRTHASLEPPVPEPRPQLPVAASKEVPAAASRLEPIVEDSPAHAATAAAAPPTFQANTSAQALSAAPATAPAAAAPAVAPSLAAATGAVVPQGAGVMPQMQSAALDDAALYTAMGQEAPSALADADEVGEGYSDGDDEEAKQHAMEQQAAFVQCFKDELLGQRPLLLSQLNNLYKMRSGEELNYKASGYEKLRDFLMDIPGLSLVGRGNRMQVRLGDANEFEAFQRTLEEQANTGQTPHFRMPQPLPETLQRRLLELFMKTEGHEVMLRNFLNVWSSFYPTEQLAYRSLGFRDVRGLLSNVPFIEKVGGKHDAKYVLRRTDMKQLPSQQVDPLSVDLQQAASAAGGAAAAAATQSQAAARDLNGAAANAAMLAGRMPPGQNALHQAGEVRPWNAAAGGRGSGAPVRQQDAAASFRKPQQGQAAPSGSTTAAAGAAAQGPAAGPPGMLNLGDMIHGGLGGAAYGAKKPFAGNVPARSAGGAEASSSMGVLPGSMHVGQVPAIPQQPLQMPSFGVELENVYGRAPAPAGGAMPQQLNLGQQNPSSAGNAAPQRAPDGSLLNNTALIAKLTEVLGNSSETRERLVVSAPGPGGAAPPTLAGGFAAGGASGGAGPSGVEDVPAMVGLGAGTWGAGAAAPAAASSAAGAASGGTAGAASGAAAHGVPALVGVGGRGLAGSGAAGGATGLGLPAMLSDDRFDDASSLMESDAGQSTARNVELEDESPSISRSADVLEARRARQAARRMPRAHKSASFFVSSPGAFSSETRDASIHQGKFDMCSVLQTQLRHGSPCLVLDISGGQVMVSNNECEGLFETTEAKSQLVQNNIFNLIHTDDRDKFSTCFAYLMVSERTRLDPIDFRILTAMGRSRKVRVQGVQLIGMWWQLDFDPVDGDQVVTQPADAEEWLPAS